MLDDLLSRPDKNKNQALKQLKLNVMELDESLTSVIEYLKDHELRLRELEELKPKMQKMKEKMIAINAALGAEKIHFSVNADKVDSVDASTTQNITKEDK